MIKKSFFVFAIVLQAFITNAQAQQISLDPVTVTASLSEKRSSETGRNISIIKGASLAQYPIHSMDDLLKYIPGVELLMRGPQGSQSDINLRGGTFQQVLVILDGLRLNDPNTGHFTAYIPITPAEIDRIEVLKGASSAVYGSDAVGGVINIITKSFNVKKQAESKNLSGQIGIGEYGFVSTNLGGFYQKNNLSIGGGVLSNHATGVQQRGTKGFFHNTSAGVSLSYRLNNYWNIAIRSTYDNRHFAAQNFYTTFLSDTANEAIQSWWHQAKIGYEKNKSKITMLAGYKTLTDEYQYNSLSIANNNKSKLLQGFITYEYVIAPSATITTGFNYLQKQINSNDRGNHRLHTAAPFVSFVQKIGNHFTLYPSLRLELIENLKAQLIPQLNTSYKLNNLQLRASGGRSLRDADFTERYNNNNKSIVKSGRIGNPALMPEQSWNYEIGVDWFYKGILKLSSSFFQRFHTNLIDWTTTPYAAMPRKTNLDPTGTYALAKNIAKVTTTGWETDLQYTKKIDARQNLFLSGGIIWLDSKTSEGQPSFYLSSHAKFLSNFIFLYAYDRFSISLSGIYKNREPQQASAIQAAISKDYFLLNTKLSAEVLKKRLALYLQADNLLDRSYSDLLGAPMPGRWIQGGFQFNL